MTTVSDIFDQQASAEARGLLADVTLFVRKFVVLPGSASHLTIALYVMHTWAFEAAHATPYLVVESPEKQSGKTRLLEVLELICRNPVKAASITAAALFQTVSEGTPTLLLDEADAIFAGNSERNEDLRGVLNAGNAHGSVVIRGGKDGKPQRYQVFCPKVIAGIATGKLPDTIRDRAVVIAMDRKLKAERVERLRFRQVQTEVEDLRERLRGWADRHAEQLERYELPEPLDRLSDRMEEAWEPLLAIASLAGGKYLEQAIQAAESLAAADKEINEDNTAHTLLFALRDVFGDQEAMSSRSIVDALNADPELGFGAWNDRSGIQQRELARLLKRYRVSSRKVKVAGTALQGYHRKQFQGAWERYGGGLGGTTGTSQCSRAIPGFESRNLEGEGSAPESAENPRPIREVPGVSG